MKTTDLKTFVREWVKDLRSGKFRQTTGQLCKIEDGTPTYCCLGVACVTGKRMGLCKKAFDSKDDYKAGMPAHQWFLDLFDGIEDPSLEISGEGHQTCTTANDTLKYNFKQIADALERTYLK